VRRTKYVGFLVIAFGILLMVSAAVLPVSPATQRLGPFRVDIRGDNCGPAGYVAYKGANSVCRDAAHRRLLATSAVGLIIVAMGMAFFAGGDERRGSRIEVGTPRVVKDRTVLRSPGSRL